MAKEAAGAGTPLGCLPPPSWCIQWRFPRKRGATESGSLLSACRMWIQSCPCVLTMLLWPWTLSLCAPSPQSEGCGGVASPLFSSVGQRSLHCCQNDAQGHVHKLFCSCAIDSLGLSSPGLLWIRCRICSQLALRSLPPRRSHPVLCKALPVFAQRHLWQVGV